MSKNWSKGIAFFTNELREVDSSVSLEQYYTDTVFDYGLVLKDCSTSDDYIEKQKLDLPQEIIVKIREQTKTKLDSSTILPSYHFKSNMLARVRKTRFGVSGGGYSVISKPILTEKRGVDHFDWTFFTG